MRLCLGHLVVSTVLAVAFGSCAAESPTGARALPVIWSVPTPRGSGTAWDGQPSARDGIAYLATGTGLQAIEANSGRRVWDAALWTAKSPSAFNVELGDDAVFVNDADSVYAVALANGARRWAVQLGASANYGHTLAAGDLVLTTTTEPSIAALEATSGQVRWRIPLPAAWDSGGSFTGLAVSGDTVYAAVNRHISRNGALKRGGILALSRMDGRLLWSTLLPDSHSSAGRRLAVQDRLVMTSDLYGNSVFAVDRFSGQVAWRVPGEPGNFGPDDGPVVAGDTAYFGSNDRHVYAINWRMGSVIWQGRAPGSIHAIALCGPYLLASNLALTVLPRGGRGAPATMLSDEDGALGFAMSGIAETRGIAVLQTSKATVGVRCDTE